MTTGHTDDAFGLFSYRVSERHIGSGITGVKRDYDIRVYVFSNSEFSSKERSFWKNSMFEYPSFSAVFLLSSITFSENMQSYKFRFYSFFLPKPII